ncbi:MAG: DHHA1 domain-containing protein, partial [bacterium]
ADCGSSNVAEIALAKELGMDVIVVDHHQQSLEIPKADAILNCSFDNEDYPFKKFSAAGVSFKLVQALVKTVGDKLPAGFDKWLLDLVALSTVTDMMPLLGENRILVTYGLVVMAKTRNIGLKQLMETANIDFKNLTAYQLGFVLGPRINAAGRMDHANGAFNLLTAVDEGEAKKLAVALQQTNTERQAMTNKLVELAKQQAEEQKDELVVVIKGDGWPVGIIGLIAGKIMERYSKPVFVFTDHDTELTASGRSPAVFNIMEAIETCKDLFSRFGGHPQACGLTLKSKELLEEFIRRIRETVRGCLTMEKLQPVIKVEAEITLTNINWQLMEHLTKLEPFGIGNPKPKFLISKVKVMEARAVGQAQTHLRLAVRDGGLVKTGIGFGLAPLYMPLLRQDTEIDIVTELDANEWNGNKELQLKINDLKLCGS